MAAAMDTQEIKKRARRDIKLTFKATALFGGVQVIKYTCIYIEIQKSSHYGSDTTGLVS